VRRATHRLMLFAGLGLGLAVAGCGGDENSAAVPSGKVSGELTMWAQGLEAEKLGAMTKQFEAENPGVKVTVTPIPWDTAHDKYLTSIAGAKTPDLAHIGTTWNAEFAKAGALETVPDSIDAGRFFPSAESTTEIDGDRLGVPWYVATQVIFYRTDIAKKAGITAPPKTWDELKTMAVAMQEKGGAKYGFALKTQDWQQFLPFVWQNGGEVFDGEEFTFDTPEVIEATAFYKSFFDEGLAPPSTLDAFDPAPVFVRGTHPMFIGGPAEVSTVSELGGKGFADKWALATMPTKDSGTSFVGGGNLVVFEQSENKEAAWKFVDWMSQPAQQVRFFEESADLPAVEDAWNDPALTRDKNIAIFGKQLEDTKAPPAIARWEEIGSMLNTEIEKALSGSAPPEESLQGIQEKAESIGAS